MQPKRTRSSPPVVALVLLLEVAVLAAGPCADAFALPVKTSPRLLLLPRTSPRIFSILTAKENFQKEENTRNINDDRKDVPEEYVEVLQLLRQAWASRHEDDMPPTSLARAKIIRSRRQAKMKTNTPSSKKAPPSAASFTLANPRFLQKGGNLPKTNVRFPELADAVFSLEDKLRRIGAIEDFRGDDGDDDIGSASCTINCHAAFLPHTDSGVSAGLSYTVGLGDYLGGDLVIEDFNEKTITEQNINIRYSPFAMEGWRQRQWTQPFEGERFSLVWFTEERTESKSNGENKPTKRETKAQRVAALVAQTKIKGENVADIAAQYGLLYRPYSTDVEAILEVIGDKNNKPPCYVPEPSWSPQGHVVLDVGCHIGAFSKYALALGAQSVTAYEPEPANAALARQNLDMPQATLIEAALANLNDKTCASTSEGSSSIASSTNATLVLGRQRNDGAMNTWRHSIRIAGDTETQVSSRDSGKKSIRESSSSTGDKTCTVHCFDFYQVLAQSRATFVKMDVEGAELSILDTFTPGSWTNVRRLVFEYSFTKRRSMAPFHSIVQALEIEGFEVSYDFRDTLLEELEEWPGTTDVLIFCSK